MPGAWVVKNMKDTDGVPFPARLWDASGTGAGPFSFAHAAPKATVGTQSSVASSAADVTVLAANADRIRASVYNDSEQILYLLLGAGTSSLTNYTAQVQPQGFFEFADYIGVVKGIWAAANGFARVTEHLP
jgi:hypothetical protein